MDAGTSRREFIRRALFGAGIGGLFSSVRAAPNSAKTDSRLVDRRRLGRTGADVSILGLGLGAAFMEQSHGTAYGLLESALATGITYWDTARSYGPSEGMIAPALKRNRNRVFLASKSDARDYDGFKRDLNRSLQVLRTDYLQGDDTPADARARTSTVNPFWRALASWLEVYLLLTHVFKHDRN